MSNLVSGDTYIALPGGGAVPASSLYQQDPATGMYIAPSTDYASGYGGTTYQIGQHTDWFSPYSSGGDSTQQQPPPQTGDPSGAALASSLLTQYGLQELLPYVEQIARGTLTWAELQAQLYDPSTKPGQVVDKYFPEIQLRRKAGFEPISIDQIQALREQYMQVFRSHDVPSGFYDSVDDFKNLIVYDKSPDELNADLNQWRTVANDAAADPSNQSILSELHRFYGISADSGAFLSYVIDPQRGLDVIRNQVASSQESSIARRTGYGALNQAEAEALAARGITPDAAQQGFGELVHEQQLFDVLPGESGAGIGREDQLAAEFGGNAADQQAIAQVRGQRLAAFAGGGRVAAGQGSDTGLNAS